MINKNLEVESVGFEEMISRYKEAKEDVVINLKKKIKINTDRYYWSLMYMAVSMVLSSIITVFGVSYNISNGSMKVVTLNVAASLIFLILSVLIMREVNVCFVKDDRKLNKSLSKSAKSMSLLLVVEVLYFLINLFVAFQFISVGEGFDVNIKGLVFVSVIVSAISFVVITFLIYISFTSFSKKVDEYFFWAINDKLIEDEDLLNRILMGKYSKHLKNEVENIDRSIKVKEFKKEIDGLFEKNKKLFSDRYREIELKRRNGDYEYLVQEMIGLNIV